MTESPDDILEGDPFALGITGYTLAQGEAMLAGATFQSVEVSGDFSCIHRGELLEIGKCDLCGVRGQPLEIFACSAGHERCSVLKRRRDTMACGSCPDRKSLDDSDPPG